MSGNAALIQKVTASVMYIENNDHWISCTVLNKTYAVTALQCIPEESRKIGQSFVLCGSDGSHHDTLIHGINQISDYIVFRKVDGEFGNYPEIICPSRLDQYIAVGFSFGEKKPSIRLGQVSSISNECRGFFYGTSGGLPGFSGGGVFYVRSGRLMGIARSNEWQGKDTNQFTNVLEVISVHAIFIAIEAFHHHPFTA
ncbi:unnamed protein product [Caenorhabditis brenneri]